MKHKGLSQLLCAALVDRQFQKNLLQDPVQSLKDGYLDYWFDLSSDEEQMLKGIHAANIEDFALQVHQWIDSSAGIVRSIENLQVNHNIFSRHDGSIVPEWNRRMIRHTAIL